jgi:Protein of unknown function (DUF3303)
MKFIVSWELPPPAFQAASDRFLKTGGLPPESLKLIGRWHGMSGRGFAVVETTDAKALYHWVSEWGQFLPIETTPCVEDADAGAVLQSLKA